LLESGLIVFLSSQPPFTGWLKEVISEEGASKRYKPPIEAFISGFSANPLAWFTPQRLRVKTVFFKVIELR
jgi:hypothetical protein